jgi:FtsH-binding integral membrane protein
MSDSGRSEGAASGAAGAVAPAFGAWINNIQGPIAMNAKRWFSAIVLAALGLVVAISGNIAQPGTLARRGLYVLCTAILLSGSLLIYVSLSQENRRQK